MNIDANLVVEIHSIQVYVSAFGKDVMVKVPDLATGLSLVASALPRGFRRPALDMISGAGLSVYIVVGKRTVLEIGGRSSCLWFVGWPHTRLRLVSSTLAALGI